MQSQILSAAWENSEKLNFHECNRPFAVGGHVTTATFNQSVITKWHPEIERVG